MKHLQELAVSVFLTGLAVPLMGEDWRVVALFALGWALWVVFAIAPKPQRATVHYHNHIEETTATQAAFYANLREAQR